MPRTLQLVGEPLSRLAAGCGHPEAIGTFRLLGHPEWLVTATLHSDGMAVALTSLSISFDRTAGEPDVSLTAAVLRATPIGALTRMLRDAARDSVPDDEATAVEGEARMGLARPEWWVSDPPAPRSEWAVEIVGDRRTGRKGHTDRLLAQFAFDYVQLLSGPAPRAHLAEQSNLSVGATKKRLETCRERGLLTRPAAGSGGGGHLTRKAKEILDGTR